MDAPPRPPRYRVLVGDCRASLAMLPDNCVDSVVTDPPYELWSGKSAGGGGFMGKAWDGTGIAFDVGVWREVLRVLKPGGHLLAFGGTRTQHRMVCAIEDGGFDVRDLIAWHHATGFPKSKSISMAIDEELGADEAKRWDGYGTALKPSTETVCVARKPLDGTYAANVLKWGAGGLNIDGCRIGEGAGAGPYVPNGKNAGYGAGLGGGEWDQSKGRWPANVILDEGAAAELDRQSGVTISTQGKPRGAAAGTGWGMTSTGAEYDDAGGASRFFFVAKPDGAERDAGCEDLPEASRAEATGREEGSAGSLNPRAGAGAEGRRNVHATVKPIDLMRYLVRLVTPPGGLVLDPFAGSGTTGIGALLEGCYFLGLELDTAHACIAVSRLRHWEGRSVARDGKAGAVKKEDARQRSLL